MTTITFDTHEFIKTLRDSGIPESQAEAMAKVQKASLSEVMDAALATKGDIQSVRADTASIKLELADVRSDIKILRWMLGLILAGVFSLIMKAFFAA